MDIRGKVLQWGNSYAIRLSKPQARQAGLRPGMEVDVHLRPPTRPYPVADLPTFRPLRPARDEQDDAASGAWAAHQDKMG